MKFLVRFILELFACVWYLFLCLEEAWNHYHVPPTRFRMKSRNFECGCDISRASAKPAQSDSRNSFEKVSLIERGWWYVWRPRELLRNEIIGNVKMSSVHKYAHVMKLKLKLTQQFIKRTSYQH